MKTMRFLLLSLLAIATASPAVAQVIEDGEAFYIYRNDGNFDGFFYDEVKEIRYSKLDLDSVAHDDYVVQEVVLEDSIHRIPLAAIDSVGFAQPEIKFNPALKNMDELGITPYVTAVSGQVLTVLKTLPATLRPKKNDVLVGFTGVLEEKGFGGKVIRVIDNGDSWRVQTEKLNDLKDLFVQFICIEQVKADEQGNAKRRMSGLNGPRKASGGGSLNIVDLSGTITGEVDFPGGSASANAEVGVKFSIGVAYNITWKSIFTKLSTHLGMYMIPSTTVKTGKEFELPLTGIPKFLKSIKFPATCPLFQTTPLPDFFFRGSGELSFKCTLPKMQLNINQSFIIDSSQDFPLSYTLSTTPDIPTVLGNDFIDLTTTDFSLELAGFVQTGISFRGNIETNDWVSDIFSSSIGVYLYVGPKLEGSLKLSAVGLAGDGAYGMLKNSKVKLTAVSADLEAKGKIKILRDDLKEKVFFSSNKSFGEWEWYLLPELRGVFGDFDVSNGDLVYQAYLGKDTPA